MKNIFKNSKRGIAAILTLCILLGIAGTCVYAASIPEENTAPTEETTQELIPIMARMCYDYKTVDECMRDISSIYGFDYSLSGNNYTCSGNYSVLINNSHNYLNVVLSYNGMCIAMYMCSRR